jgi:hypothetical protein
MKNSNNTIRNRTRDLSACSAVPQPTAPPRVHIVAMMGVYLFALGWYRIRIPDVVFGILIQTFLCLYEFIGQNAAKRIMQFATRCYISNTVENVG